MLKVTVGKSRSVLIHLYAVDDHLSLPVDGRLSFLFAFLIEIVTFRQNNIALVPVKQERIVPKRLVAPIREFMRIAFQLGLITEERVFVRHISRH
jgi:hypothetical protein